MGEDMEYLWKANQEALGLSDAELELMKKNAKAVKLIRNSPDLVRKKIVAEVVQAKHCVYHKVGDKFVFRVAGGMVGEETCESPCLYALGPLATLGYIVFDRVAAGLDTSELMIDGIKCMDTGIECGGVGEILMKVRVE